MDRTVISIAVALVGLSMYIPFAQSQSQSQPEPYWLGEARGPHRTGTIEELWTDQSRGEPQTSDLNDKRRLMIRIWYPASAVGEADGAPYAPNIELYSRAVRDELAAVAARETRSVMNAAVEAGTQRYPVLIFNHGGGAPNFTSTFLTEFLASGGYVVVSVGHTGSDGVERFPDGSRFVPDSSEPLTEEQRASLTPRETYLAACNDTEVEESSVSGVAESVQEAYATEVRDITFVLDRLTEAAATPGSRFYGRLDLARVGAFGWSAGGATAFQAAVDDPRVRAAVNFDGWLYCRPVESSGSPVPIMLVESTETGAPGPAELVDPGMQELVAEVNRRVWQLLRLTKADWYRVTIVGAAHRSFSDAYYASTPPPGVLPQERAGEIIQALTLEFFNKYLERNEDSPILSRERRIPEVRVRTLRPSQ